MIIKIAEYKNIVDSNDNPFGHSQKVLYEAANLCKEMEYDVIIAASPQYLRDVPVGLSKSILPYVNMVRKYNFHALIKIFKNIKSALSGSKTDLVWFTNIDWFLFLYLGTHLINSHIVVTAYRDFLQDIESMGKKGGFARKILYYFALKGTEKVDLTIKTYTFNQDKNENVMYMPDYIYSKEYERYRMIEKQHRVACVGTMNTLQKDLFGLIKAFARIEIPLLIIGEFTSEVDFEKACQLKTNNVTIINKYLDVDDYYEALAFSEYVILPYRMEKYQSSTSGVLREALYVGAKIIAPKIMLSNMRIDGLGFEMIEEVSNWFDGTYIEPQLINDLSRYDKETIKINLKHHFNEMRTKHTR